jgi:hypothetical protein
MPIFLKYPLLHWKDKTGWQDWFAAMNVDTGPCLSGVVIDDANAVLQAALNGQGVAIGLLPLIENELKSGALICAFANEFTPSKSYHLVYPPAALRKLSLMEFRDWIIAEASGYRIHAIVLPIHVPPSVASPRKSIKLKLTSARFHIASEGFGAPHLLRRQGRHSATSG